MTTNNTQAPVLIYADGGSRGNPGPSGCGVAIKSAQDSSVIAGFSQFLGITTNNVAEYSGLVLGLKEAQRLGYQHIEVRMDSELVVKQMLGIYKVKNENLKPLYYEAQKLSRAFNTFKIVHVRREQNKDADRLANEAMNQGATASLS